MKKFKKIILVVTFFIFVANLSTYVSASTTDDKVTLKTVINNFLKNQIDSIQSNTPISSDELMYDTKLKEYSKLQNDYFNMWYKKLNIKLLKYNLSTNFKTIIIKNNTAKINVSTDFNLTFSNSPNINQQGSGDNYYFVLKKKNSKWLITNIVTQDNIENSKSNLLLANDYYNLNSIDNKISHLKNALTNIDNDIKDTNIKVQALSKKYFNSEIVNTRRQAAVAYAEKWCLSRNPKYKNYGDVDCTNFVSQCIYAGGYEKTTTWQPESVAWINVVAFYNFMTQKSNYGSYEYYGNANLGDVIQFLPRNSTTYNHAVIITKSSGGNLYYCAHSNNRKDYSLNNVYPSSYYSNLRGISLSYTN